MTQKNDLTQIGASLGSRQKIEYTYETTSIRCTDLTVTVTKTFRDGEQTRNYQGFIGSPDGHVLTTFHGTDGEHSVEIALKRLVGYRRDHA